MEAETGNYNVGLYDIMPDGKKPNAVDWAEKAEAHTPNLVA